MKRVSNPERKMGCSSVEDSHKMAGRDKHDSRTVHAAAMATEQQPLSSERAPQALLCTVCGTESVAETEASTAVTGVDTSVATAYFFAELNATLGPECADRWRNTRSARGWDQHKYSPRSSISGSLPTRSRAARLRAPASDLDTRHLLCDARAQTSVSSPRDLTTTRTARALAKAAEGRRGSAVELVNAYGSSAHLLFTDAAYLVLDRGASDVHSWRLSVVEPQNNI